MTALLALYYLTGAALESPQGLYGDRLEEMETEELLSFVRRASQEMERRGVRPPPPAQKVRVTRELRIFIGPSELKVRPMAKSVLLLFLRHPEGIPLKQMTSFEGELRSFYRRVSRSSDPSAIDERVARMLESFNNELNVNIARVNRAVALLTDSIPDYQIGGMAGAPKRILLDRSWVVWE
ncbi:MAG: hypothetical protein IJ753_01560 [Bacteroidales bacterium]|nr:hypothetical protein [Bacteroidales bacterium]MBR1782191.1 hypothetical protein [Bacteroidales bacterium]